MKRFKIGFLAFVALGAIAFTVISWTESAPKKAPISNCYRQQALQWLDDCSPTTLVCADKLEAQGKFVRATGFTLSTYVPGTEDCTDGNTICCVSFEDGGTIAPCASPNQALVSPATPIKAFNGADIATGRYVKVHQVECKP